MIDLEQIRWMVKGYCSVMQANPDIFYEEGNEETAKAFCTNCPVITTCREWAIANDEYGVWGGMTEVDRRAIRRGLKRASCPACDSLFLHLDDEEQICLACGMSWHINLNAVTD